MKSIGRTHQATFTLNHGDEPNNGRRDSRLGAKGAGGEAVSTWHVILNLA